MTVPCPLCFGEGRIDLRDAEALIAEHLTDEELAFDKSHGIEPLGIMDCPECDTTGIVTEARLLDIAASSRAAIDQVLALLADQGVDFDRP